MSLLEYKSTSKHSFPTALASGIVQEATAFFDTTPLRLLQELKQFNPFEGAGVYALYYNGDSFKPYSVLPKGLPIYVGKACPPGWRTACVDTTKAHKNLYRRLSEHLSSIQQSHNLSADDFSCRYMIVSLADTDLIAPIESELIKKHRPLWNATIDGFGNHDPGYGRYEQQASEWDVLHPGREWTKRLTSQTGPSRALLLKKVKNYTQRFAGSTC